LDSLSLPYNLYRFHLDFQHNQPISRFPAATLRGAFGYTLRGLVCMDMKINCAECILQPKCAYAYLFETLPSEKSPRLRKLKAVPRPFAIRTAKHDTQGGFEILLVGNAVSYMPYFIYTFNKLGKKGVGAQKSRFQIAQVTCGDTIVYDGAQMLEGNGVGQKVLNIFPGDTAQGGVSLHFQSPLVLRKNGAVLRQWDSSAFVTTLLRRVTNLNAFHGENPEHEIDPRLYIEAAKTLQARAELDTSENSRFSTRQKKRIDYSGLVGTVHLKGNIGTLMPLLKAGEILGVGKNTVFGFGVYALRK